MNTNEFVYMNIYEACLRYDIHNIIHNGKIDRRGRNAFRGFKQPIDKDHKKLIDNIFRSINKNLKKKVLSLRAEDPTRDADDIFNILIMNIIYCGDIIDSLTTQN